MTSALIGYTGFVGGNLARQMRFDEFYNSKNIEDIKGRSLDLVVCAGTPGEKWRANECPSADLASIVSLADALQSIDFGELVLVSTIDAIEPETPYAWHRHDLEMGLKLIRDPFIVRLPALFGQALRKNALYDLMTSNRLYDIAPNATYQWHPLRRLGADLTRILASGERTINIASEPVSMEDVRARFFPRHRIGLPSDAAPHYAIEGHPAYSLTRAEVFDEMGAFLAGHA